MMLLFEGRRGSERKLHTTDCFIYVEKSHFKPSEGMKSTNFHWHALDEKSIVFALKSKNRNHVGSKAGKEVVGETGLVIT